MPQNLINKAAQFVELRRLGMDATGIPTISDVSTAKRIDALYEEEFERRLKEAQAKTLEDAERALNRECIGFQSSWGSNPEDVARLDGIGKVMDWMKARAAKYREVLPRTINLKDTYEGLSDGAVIECDGTEFSHRIGFGDFENEYGDRIVARFAAMDVKLVSHNL